MNYNKHKKDIFNNCFYFHPLKKNEVFIFIKKRKKGLILKKCKEQKKK
jgi:hypothetical protein